MQPTSVCTHCSLAYSLHLIATGPYTQKQTYDQLSLIIQLVYSLFTFFKSSQLDTRKRHFIRIRQHTSRQMSTVLQTSLGQAIDDNEVSCSSISSASSCGVVKHEWKLIRSNITLGEIDFYLTKDLPKNSCRTSRTTVCNICDKNDNTNKLHKMTSKQMNC